MNGTQLETVEYVHRIQLVIMIVRIIKDYRNNACYYSTVNGIKDLAYINNAQITQIKVQKHVGILRAVNGVGINAVNRVVVNSMQQIYLNVQEHFANGMKHLGLVQIMYR